jgi:hypothetical protein
MTGCGNFPSGRSRHNLPVLLTRSLKLFDEYWQKMNQQEPKRESGSQSKRPNYRPKHNHAIFKTTALTANPIRSR